MNNFPCLVLGQDKNPSVSAKNIQERARFIQTIYDSELITDFDLERRTDYDPAGKTDSSQGTDNTKKFEESEKILNILLVNICGLKSKLKAPDFDEAISHHNMIVLTETKLDDLDSTHINNFKLINNNRKYRKKASGGVLSITLFLVTSPRWIFNLKTLSGYQCLKHFKVNS